MQYSNNSNAGLLAIIYSNPTPAGQWRQAMLQIRDRLHALEDFDLERRKQEQIITLKRTERNQLLTTEPNEQVRAARMALIELEIEQAVTQIKRTQELVDDAQRELEFCRAVGDRICQDSGIEFNLLNTEQFQQLMAIDFAKKRDKFIASRLLALRAGLPVDAAELILEIPASEQRQALANAQQMLEPLLIQPTPAIADGIN